MIVLKGDKVKLKSGELAKIIDIWGSARLWCKLKTSDGTVIFAMSESIESVVVSSLKKRERWGKT